MAKIENFDGQELVDKVQEKFQANRNYVYIGIAAIVLVIGGFWWFNKQSKAKNMEANELLWKPMFDFERDSFDLAINGSMDEMGYRTQGFAAIASEYGSTKAGQIAKYSMGVGYLNMGNFDGAIQALEDVDFDDEILGAVAKGALGDAYYEKGEAGKAKGAYQDAIDHSENEFTAPIYLKKLASVLEDLNETDKAIECYEKIKKDFPNSNEAYGIEKYIARLSK